MILKKWEDLPDYMKNDSVRKYYVILKKRRFAILAKYLFDLFASILALIILFPIFLILFIAIKIDSKGPVLFRQLRVTQYGRRFYIFKFRTMVNNAEKIGTQVTTRNDKRVTRVGKVLRKYRLDEIPQLFNILRGDMSFVGTRPEVVKFVERYTEEMMATLLLPAGITSEASILYKNEERLLEDAVNADKTYLEVVLPEKMKYNLESIERFSFFEEIKTMIKTVAAVAKRDTDNSNTINSNESGTISRNI